MDFRRAFTTFGAVVIAAAVSVPSYAQDRGQAASQGTPQPPQEKKKLSKDDLASYEAMNTLVNNVVAGKQPAPADVKLTFHNHFLKSSQNIYIPYAVDVEPGKLTTTHCGWNAAHQTVTARRLIGRLIRGGIRNTPRQRIM